MNLQIQTNRKTWLYLFYLWLLIVFSKNYYIYVWNGDQLVNTPLAKVNRTNDKWILNVNIAKSGATVVVENHVVKVNSPQEKGGKWTMITESYNIPSGYNQITSKNLYGRVLVIGRKCVKGSCTVDDDDHFLWDLFAKTIPGITENFKIRMKRALKFSE